MLWKFANLNNFSQFLSEVEIFFVQQTSDFLYLDQTVRKNYGYVKKCEFFIDSLNTKIYIESVKRFNVCGWSARSDFMLTTQNYVFPAILQKLSSSREDLPGNICLFQNVMRSLTFGSHRHFLRDISSDNVLVLETRAQLQSGWYDDEFVKCEHDLSFHYEISTTRLIHETPPRFQLYFLTKLSRIKFEKNVYNLINQCFILTVRFILFCKMKEYVKYSERISFSYLAIYVPEYFQISHMKNVLLIFFVTERDVYYVQFSIGCMKSACLFIYQ